MYRFHNLNFPKQYTGILQDSLQFKYTTFQYQCQEKARANRAGLILNIQLFSKNAAKQINNLIKISFGRND